ncbi:MAG TPA: Hsp20/alpha crystallin family protein [Steroidobacteraceae bacterium]|jgi:HSP20 family molecular chaperone IbpA|nr:Hsp20/alpha crystallin family protein [Steroidobacteraceae bacterium]
MATNTEVTRHGAAAAAQASSGSAAQRAQAGEAPIRPPVDIWEDKEGITLCADMPGVSRERLNVRVDGNNLIVEGQVQLELPENAEALYADIRSGLYRRTFSLSGELETGKIEASLKDGVLTVRIPKRAELRPRKIEVRAS